MILPSESDINPVKEDLDGQVAVRNFLGKTREEIASDFLDNGLSLQEDLLHMGPKAFVYYFPAAVDYVTSGKAVGDCDVVSSLCGVIECRLKEDVDDFSAVFPAMMRFVDYVQTHYDEFGLNPEIYGDLRPRLRGICSQCA